MFLLFQLSELIIIKRIGDKLPNQKQIVYKLINSNIALLYAILLNGNGLSLVGNMIIECFLIMKHYSLT